MSKWLSRKEGFKNALDYIQGRATGKISSLITPWPKFNDATTNGIEWKTLNVIAGRPGSFKTGLKDQIIRESFALNPTHVLKLFTVVYRILCSSDLTIVPKDDILFNLSLLTLLYNSFGIGFMFSLLTSTKVTKNN